MAKLTFEFDTFWKRGLIGYLNFTVSIERRWAGDSKSTSYPTWRHITLGFRSPVVFYRGRNRFAWFPLRFGYGCGNVYLGVVYVVTTFGRQYPGIKYRELGPFQLATPQ